MDKGGKEVNTGAGIEDAGATNFVTLYLSRIISLLHKPGRVSPELDCPPKALIGSLSNYYDDNFKKQFV